LRVEGEIASEETVSTSAEAPNVSPGYSSPRKAGEERREPGPSEGRAPSRGDGADGKVCRRR
jgi:hypothetical protein